MMKIAFIFKVVYPTKNGNLSEPLGIQYMKTMCVFACYIDWARLSCTQLSPTKNKAVASPFLKYIALINTKEIYEIQQTGCPNLPDTKCWGVGVRVKCPGEKDFVEEQGSQRICGDGIGSMT